MPSPIRPKTVFIKKTMRVAVLPLEEEYQVTHALFETLNAEDRSRCWLIDDAIRTAILKGRKRSLAEFLKVKKIDAIITVGQAYGANLKALKKATEGLLWAHYGELVFSKKEKGLPQKIFSFTEEAAQNLRLKGMNASFLGHPLFEELAPYVVKREEKPLKIAFIPPLKHLRYVMPSFIELIHYLRQKRGDVEVCIPLTQNTKPRFFEPYSALGAVYLRGESIFNVLAEAHVAICYNKYWHTHLALLNTPFIEVKTPQGPLAKYLPIQKFILPRSTIQGTPNIEEDIQQRSPKPAREGAFSTGINIFEVFEEEAYTCLNALIKKEPPYHTQMQAFAKIQRSLAPQGKNIIEPILSYLYTQNNS